jgi:hypothetical protein
LLTDAFERPLVRNNKLRGNKASAKTLQWFIQRRRAKSSPLA